jgi:hypothetical protein
MIPFLPSQNPNVAALLASVGGSAPKPGAEAGSNFAPVFGNAIVGQLVAGLPASAFSGGEEGINPAAWAQLAEAVRVLTQNGAVSPAILEQMRGVMLVNIEQLRRGASETLAMQSVAVPPSLPVAPTGVVGAPVNEALIPAPAVPNAAQTDEPSRRRDTVGGAEAMLMAATAGMPVPAGPAARPEMNVEQAFAALERIVAQAPASELVSLARSLRQVLNAPVAVPAAGIRQVQVSASKGGEIPAAVSAGAAAPASERAGAPVSPRVVDPSSAPAVPVAGNSPAATDISSANPAPVLVAVPVVESGESPVTAVSVANPAPRGGEARSAPGITAGVSVSGMTVEDVAVVTTAALSAVVSPATDETVPAAAISPVIPSDGAATEPVEPSFAPVVSPVETAYDGPATLAPLYIPANDAPEAERPAFAIAQPDAAAELEAVAVPSGEVAPMIAEPVDEPVAWLARQAQAGGAEIRGNNPSIPAPAVEASSAEMPAPAANTATVAAAPVEGGAVEMTAIPGAGASSAPRGAAATPAIEITTIEVESLPASAASQVRSVQAPAANNEVPSAIIPAVSGETAEVAVPAAVRPAEADAASQPAVNTAVETEPVRNAASPAVPAAPVFAEADVPVAPVTAETAPVYAGTPAVSAQDGEGETPELAQAPVATASNSGQVDADKAAPRREGNRAAQAGNEGGEKPAKTPVTGGESAQAVERTGAPARAKSARIGATETANTAADAAINAARGQAREAVSLPVAVQAVMARIADAIATAKPGEIRQLDLKLATPELGMVRVKFEVGEEGMVRVVIKTSTEMAATAIRDGLPQFRNTVDNRHISVQVTQVAVGTAADFGGGNNPHARPEWLTPFQPQASAVNRDEPEFTARAPEGYLRRRTLVDILA